MNGSFLARHFERSRLIDIADWLAVALAASLPWSTSASSILIVLWIIAVLPTLEADDVLGCLAVPAAWLPLALAGFAAVGMLWADVALSARLGSVEAFGRLLVIPLLLVHFQRSERALWVLGAFLASCVPLLIASTLPIFVPALQWMWHKKMGFAMYGVPVKDYISQSGEFLLCIFSALYFAFDLYRKKRWIAALGCLALAVPFAASIVYVTTGRTAIVTIPFVLLVFALRYLQWKGVTVALVVGIVAASVAWTTSSYLRSRVAGIITEIQQYESKNAYTSSGERLEFWKKSLRFISEAPVLGHGTGSIKSQFGTVVGTAGPATIVSTNPHNQTLTIAIQIGLVGAALLWAMWIAHFLLFRADGFIAWFGTVVVIQNVIGSLFNSLLFDFTLGWIYVVGVGVAGGAILRAQGRSAFGLAGRPPPLPLVLRTPS